MKPVRHHRNTQHGAALLVLFLIIFTVSATVFLSSVNTNTVEIRRHQDVRAEMEKAKQALIAYAMNYPGTNFDYVVNTIIMDEGPGRLPCPDTDDPDADTLGLANSNATDCTNYVRGRLPKQYIYSGNRIEINDTFADIDQQFWYVVSPAFKEITTTNVNHLTAGDLTIDGSTETYVAVIIAPGPPLDGQDRSASQTMASNYLEQGNITGTAFINSYPANPDAFNDQVIGIKASEFKLDTIRGTADSPLVFAEPARQAFYAYYQANGNTLPANATTLSTFAKNNGFGWLFDEGYMNSASNPMLTNYYRDAGYPYVRYNLPGCATYYYWFIPVSPYSPNNTYASGTPC